MKTYKIYSAVYPLDETTSVAPDAYAIKGELVDDPPKGKKVGYVTMRDGSIIECYTKFNPLVVIIPLAIIAIAAASLFVYFYFFQPKDVVVGEDDSFIIKQGTDNNVVTYNGFMALRNGSLSVDFTNGDYPCTISVSGNSIDCDPVTVQPGEHVDSIPATYNTESGVVNATLTITTDTSTTDENVVIEIPDNNTEDSDDTGLEGYWKGEYIYGTSVE